ncbi:hypothetical protein DSO57_1015824 [Entomophthora muscae]|uniref:Uncharacterized protein n=2 Tax=Entomophthora muscae TaxID=34485 RepID=A0ACC2TFQ3_9FUNG|nr:hypothetical protein DSO57_1015823 [Entomophthora muscae]KAJ9073494.1 hypothetical protein DSO57_1015824 [Entomophthora muscae]
MSISMLYSTAQSSIKACFDFGSLLLPWMPLNALSAALKPFQVVTNACFYSFTSRSSPTDNACFSGITATIPSEGDEPSVVMFVGTFFTEHKLPPKGKPQRNLNSRHYNIADRPARTASAQKPLELDDELSLMFNTSCRI